MTAKGQAGEFTSGRRKSLLLEMARAAEGVTAKEVHQRAVSLGDAVTEEAYYNIARRLAHRGLLRIDDSSTPSRYFARPEVEGRWLEEDDLAALVDPDYPLLALSIANESARQMKEVPESVWIELRRRLRLEPARELFCRAIESYVEDFHRQLKLLIELEAVGASELPRLRQEAENSRQLIVRLVRFGLGLSREAVDIPITVDAAERLERAGKTSFINRDVLKSELERRVSEENFLEWTSESTRQKSWLIGAVDGSTRGGILSFLGEGGDFVVGHAPMVSINTAVGQINRLRTQGDRKWPLFTRLPERPEDMQRQDNRFTVMAKLLNPDMSDAQYMHSVWNAMDLIETRTAERLLEGWTTPENGIEVPAVDVVLRDGAVSPQDRDFYHYADPTTYGRIVREAIRLNWKIAKGSSEDDQDRCRGSEDHPARCNGPGPELVRVTGGS